MHFLVSNDDGINASGVKALAEVLLEFGTVTVICPDSERSGFSHSFTTTRPIKLKKVNFHPAIKAYSIDGTPVDCIKAGLDIILDSPPDFVFTGMNLGANVGQDIFYSGTIGAARESVLKGVPAVAVSAARSADHTIDFEQAKALLKPIVAQIIQMEISEKVLLNVNIPAVSPAELKGIRVVEMETSEQRFKFTHYQDPKDRPVYWLSNQYPVMPSHTTADYHLVRDGYLTISPIEVSRANPDLVQQFSKKFN